LLISTSSSYVCSRLSNKKISSIFVHISASYLAYIRTHIQTDSVVYCNNVLVTSFAAMLLLMGDRWAAGGFTRMEMVLELVMNVLSRRYYAKIPICVNVESHGLGIWMSLHYSVGTV